MNLSDSEELEIDEKSFVAATYMARVANEIRRAASIEKAARKITQQSIADKVGTSRAVINREMSGSENLSARRTAEILWALGWEPHFEARKIPAGENHFYKSESTESNAQPTSSITHVDLVETATPLSFKMKLIATPSARAA